jgi:hypothetical protein
MNDLPDRQNTEQSIDYLVAQRRLYSKAKRWFLVRSATVVALAILGPLIGAEHPNWKAAIALASLAWLGLDLAFEWAENELRSLAARVQELFDCHVFGFEWNPIVAGDRPEAEDVRTNSKGATKEARSQVENWYPVSVRDLDEPTAVCVCQRSNVAWDSRLRWFFAFLICLLLVVVAAASLTMVWSTKVCDALTTLAPLVPLLKLLLTQAVLHLRTAKQAERLKRHADKQLDGAMKGTPAEQLTRRSRAIQDELFRYRKAAPLVPDLFYWIFQKTFEDRMRYSAAAKVAEFVACRSSR